MTTDIAKEFFPEQYKEEVEAQQRELDIQQSAKRNLEERSEAGRAFSRSIDEAQAFYYGAKAMAWDLLGQDEWADENLLDYQYQMDEARENPAVVNEFFSANEESGAFGSAGNFFDYVTGTAASMIPSMAESVLGAGIGALAGAAVIPAPDPADVVTVPAGAVVGALSKSAAKKSIASFFAKRFADKQAKKYLKQGISKDLISSLVKKDLGDLGKDYVGRTIGRNLGTVLATTQMTSGGLYGELESEGVDTSIPIIALAGLASGGLEAAFGYDGQIGKKLFAPAVETQAKRIFAKEGLRRGLGKVVDMVFDAGAEGFTEAGQEIISALAETSHGKTSSPKDLLKRVAESFAAGVFGSGGLSMVSSPFSGADVDSTPDLVKQSEIQYNEFVDLSKGFGEDFSFERDVDPFKQRNNFVSAVAEKVGVTDKRDIELLSLPDYFRREKYVEETRNMEIPSKFTDGEGDARLRFLNNYARENEIRLAPYKQAINNFAYDNGSSRPIVEGSTQALDAFANDMYVRMFREKEVYNKLEENGVQSLMPAEKELYDNHLEAANRLQRRLDEIGDESLVVESFSNPYYNTPKIRNIVGSDFIDDYQETRSNLTDALLKLETNSNIAALAKLDNARDSAEIQNLRSIAEQMNAASLLNQNIETEVESNIEVQGPIAELDAISKGDLKSEKITEVKSDVKEQKKIVPERKSRKIKPERKTEIKTEKVSEDGGGLRADIEKKQQDIQKQVALQPFSHEVVVEFSEDFPEGVYGSQEGNTITFSSDADDFTVRHEMFHYMMERGHLPALALFDYILMKHQKNAAYKAFYKKLQYGSEFDIQTEMELIEEIAANAYADPNFASDFMSSEDLTVLRSIVDDQAAWVDTSELDAPRGDDIASKFDRDSADKLNEFLNRVDVKTQDILIAKSQNESLWGSNWIGYVKSFFTDDFADALSNFDESLIEKDVKSVDKLLSKLSNPELEKILKRLGPADLFDVLRTINSSTIENHYKYTSDGSKFIYHDYKKESFLQSRMIKQKGYEKFHESLKGRRRGKDNTSIDWSFAKNVLGFPDVYESSFKEFASKNTGFIGGVFSKRVWNVSDKDGNIIKINDTLFNLMKNASRVDAERYLREYFYMPYKKKDGGITQFLRSPLMRDYQPMFYKKDDNTKGTPISLSSNLSDALGSTDQLKEVLNSSNEVFDVSDLGESDLETVLKSVFDREYSTFPIWLGQMGDKRQMQFKQVEKLSAKEAEKRYRSFYNGQDHLVEPDSPEFFEIQNNLKNDQYLWNFLYHSAFEGTKLFGDMTSDNYKDLTDIVKRAGSTLSAGQTMFGETANKEFNHVTINESALSMPQINPSDDKFDGVLFVSSNFMSNLKAGFGEGFFKPGDLAAVKGLYSTVEGGKRGLTKSNAILIDEVSDLNDTYRAIAKFMSDNDIDSLSTTASTKKIEGGEVVDFFDDNGNVNKKNNFSKKSIVKRKYGKFKILQDLNHDINPHAKDQLSQIDYNLIELAGFDASTKAYIDSISKKFKGTTGQLREHILSVLDPVEDVDLYNHVYQLGDLNDPRYAAQIQSKARNIIERTLKPSVSMTSHQAVPLGDTTTLKPYRIEHGKVYLPEFMVNISGIRYEGQLPDALKKKYKGSLSLTKRALKAFLETNKKHFPDMFDRHGELLEHELVSLGKDKWTVPGEIVRITRVPADNYHSHMIGRAKKQVGSGKHNLIVTDHVTQVIAGEDFDGDKRYAENLAFDGSETDNALLASMHDMYDSDNYSKFVEEIDLNYLENVLPQLEISDSYPSSVSFNNPLAQIKSRVANLDGKDALAMIANQNTLAYTIQKFKLRGDFFVDDKHGSLRSFFGVMLNLAADNAKELQLHRLGLNKHTIPYFYYRLLTDSELKKVLPNSDISLHKPAIENAVLRIANDIKSGNDVSNYFKYQAQKESMDGVRVHLKKPDALKDMAFMRDYMNIIKARKESPANYIEYSKFIKSLDLYGREFSEIDFFRGVFSNRTLLDEIYLDHYMESKTGELLQEIPLKDSEQAQKAYDLYFSSVAMENKIKGRTKESIARDIRKQAFKISGSNSFISALDLNSATIRSASFIRDVDSLEDVQADFDKLPKQLQDDLLAYHSLVYGLSRSIQAGHYLSMTTEPGVSQAVSFAIQKFKEDPKLNEDLINQIGLFDTKQSRKKKYGGKSINDEANARVEEYFKEKDSGFFNPDFVQSSVEKFNAQVKTTKKKKRTPLDKSVKSYPDIEQAYRDALAKLYWMPFNREYKPIDTVRDIQKTFENTWFRGLDEANQIAHARAQNLSKLISRVNPGKSHSELEALNMAIHLRANSGDDVFNKITVPAKEQKIIDDARNLSEENLEIVKEIHDMYAEFENVFKGKIPDGYSPQLWITDLDPSKPNRPLSSTPRYAKSRTFKNIMDGWYSGYELQVYTATENMKRYIEGVMRYQEDQKMIELGFELHASDGRSLLSTDRLPGYTEINNPAFKRDGKITLYAQDHMAKVLNRVLAPSKFDQYPFLKTLLKYNSIMKQFILQMSLFHYRALSQSYLFGGAGFSAGKLNFWKKSKDGKLTHQQSLDVDQSTDEIETMIKQGNASRAAILKFLYSNGLTHFESTDFDENVYYQSTIFSRQMDKVGALKSVKDWAIRASQAYGNHLFGVFGTGLKAEAAIEEFYHAMKQNEDAVEAAKSVSKLVNNDFGGIHHNRESKIMGVFERSKTAQDVFRLLCLAPDWTESNANVFITAIKDPLGKTLDGRLANQFIRRVAFRGAFTTLFFNLMLSMVGDDEDDDRDVMERFQDRMSDAWNQGHMAWMDIDVTPVARMFGAGADRQYYFNTIGHFKDYLKMIPDIENAHPSEYVLKPAEFAYHKSSSIFKLFSDALTGADFAGRRYSTFSEFMQDGDFVQPKYVNPQDVSRFSQIVPFTLAQFVNLMPLTMRSSFGIGKKGDIDGVKVFSDWSSAALYTPEVLYKKRYGDVKLDHISFVGKALNAVRDILPMIGEPTQVDITNLDGVNMFDKGAFHILWSEKDGVAKAVVERINPESIKDGDTYRGGGFRVDKDIERSPTRDDFGVKGSDRGHLAADANYNTYTFKNQTYQLSNIVHQDPGFNRGLWKRLESEIRAMASKDEVVVITAPVLDDWGMQTYGKNHVTVPRRFVKIVSNQDTGLITAWEMNNESSTKKLKDFRIPLKRAEKITGLKIKGLN